MLTRFLLACLLSLGLATPAWAAVIDHTFVENNTAQTTTSTTYVDVTSSSIADGNLIDGKKYLLVISAYVDEGASTNVSVKAVHGSTDFAESALVADTVSAPYAHYYFMTVWTAVASEGIKLQWKVTGAGTGTLDHLAMMAVNLTDNLTENTDWFYSERATDDSLSTTPTDGASVTLTPASASDWLVLSYAYYDVTVATNSIISRIERSGEAASAVPEARHVFSATSQFPTFMLARAYALTSASNTFTEVSASTATSQTRLHSNIFALNLNKFRDRSALAYTDGTVNLSATNYATELQTASITPSVASDVWIVTYWTVDYNTGVGREYESRIQVDNVDQPSGQTTANYQFDAGNNGDSTSEQPAFQHTMVASMSAAAHTIDVDGSVDSTVGTPRGQQRTIMAVTMELPAAGGGGRRAQQPIFLGE